MGSKTSIAARTSFAWSISANTRDLRAMPGLELLTRSPMLIFSPGHEIFELCMDIVWGRYNRLSRFPRGFFVVAHRETLPPGRLKLWTRPTRTGSLPIPNTIGIVEVALFAAIGEGSPPTAVITETLRLTRSAAKAGAFRTAPPPTGRRSSRSALRHSRFRSDLAGTLRPKAPIPPTICC